MAVRAELGVIKTKNMKMANMLSCVESASHEDKNILICGETGTGRDAIAEAIHYFSGRNDEPMYVVCCSSNSSADISGLRPGLIYLDDVHRLPKNLQKMLLFKLNDEGKNMRIISSTDRRIDDMTDRGGFYLKLYEILAGIRIDIPRLKERPEDIPMMVKEMLKKYCRKYGKQVKIESGAIKLLKYYRYPGNVAELDCIIQRAVLVNKSGTIKTNSIMSILDMENVIFASMVKGTCLEYQQEVDRLSRELIINALINTGTIRKAAAQLGLNYGTLWNKCKSLDIDISRDVKDT